MEILRSIGEKMNLFTVFFRIPKLVKMKNCWFLRDPFHSTKISMDSCDLQVTFPRVLQPLRRLEVMVQRWEKFVIFQSSFARAQTQAANSQTKKSLPPKLFKHQLFVLGTDFSESVRDGKLVLEG